jgi:hypothetical protein
VQLPDSRNADVERLRESRYRDYRFDPGVSATWKVFSEIASEYGAPRCLPKVFRLAIIADCTLNKLSSELHVLCERQALVTLHASKNYVERWAFDGFRLGVRNAT